MDKKIGPTVKMEPNTEPADDWRAELTPNIRQKVVEKILEKLNKMPCSDSNYLNRLTAIVTQFEEKTFCNAATKDNYLSAICKKMASIGNSYNHNTAASSSNPGLTQTSVLDGFGHSTSSQNVSGFSHEFVGDSVAQGMQLNICANTLEEIPGSKSSQQLVYQHQGQDLQQQFLKQKVQQPNILPTLVQPIHYQHQQQLHVVSQSSQLQYSEQKILPTQPYQALFGKKSKTTVNQQYQQHGKQNNFPEQRHPPMCQKNMSNLLQQPMTPQSNVSGVQKQKKVVGLPSNFSNLQSHQHSAHILQQAEVTTSQQKVQKTLHPVQLHQLMGSQKQSNSSLEGIQQRLETFAVLNLHQSAVDQQNQFESPRVLAEVSSASVDSTAPSELANVDWHEQAYQTNQSMKNEYLPLLKALYARYKSKWDETKSNCKEPSRPERLENYKNIMIAIDKMIKFLSISRSGIAQYPSEKIYSNQQVIRKYTSPFKNKNSVSVSVEQHARPFQHIGSQSQISGLQHDRNVKHPVNVASASTPVGSSPLSSTQSEIPNSQPNMITSLHYGSRIGLEQRNALSLLQHATRPVDQNIVGTPKEPNFSHNASLNTFDSTTKHQLMQPQNLKQQIQPQWVPQKKQQMLMQKIQLGVNSSLPHSIVGQLSEYPHQSLLPTTCRQTHAISPQTCQHSSPQFDQKNLMSLLLEAGKPLHSATSPLVVTSPSTPLTPSIPMDCEKHLTPSISENIMLPQTPIAVTEVDTQTQNQNLNQSLSVSFPGISASPLHTEFTSPNENQQSCETKQPIEHLLKVLESISPEALSAAVSEISLVVNVVDMIAGTTTSSDSIGAVGEDLMSKTRSRLQARNLSMQYECSFVKRMKRNISAVALDALPTSHGDTDIEHRDCQICDLESTATSMNKRRRIEPNNDLLDEIRYINQRLVETVINLDSNEEAAIIEAGEGTIVICSYNPMALSENLKPQYAASLTLPVLLLRLLVPANYPHSSPTILDGLTVDWSCYSKESEDLSEKAKLRFILSLRNLSEPVSLGAMVRTWDVCAHAVFSEFAQLTGGGCFSSKYGTWESCATAS